LLLVVVTSGYAQTISGTIVGVITDPSGAAIVDADVTLTNANTGTQRKTKSLANGEFVFSTLDPGRYNVSVAAPASKPWSALTST
jgi:hypothetical protein